MNTNPVRALSIRQPWATLLIHGLKTIEIRRWSTRIRGPVFIHASSYRDERPEGWSRLPERLRAEAEIGGGIIGCADLIDVREYRDQESFTAEGRLHLNEPDWFRPPIMYGFAFAGARREPFRQCTGQVRFFRVREGRQ